MDIAYFQQREQTERTMAAQTRVASARAAHLEMAERYRAVIQAYEDLDTFVAAHGGA